ncbi:hypothetical protein H0H81_002503, partial [Sphagnurus paluster]
HDASPNPRAPTSTVCAPIYTRPGSRERYHQRTIGAWTDSSSAHTRWLACRCGRRSRRQHRQRHGCQHILVRARSCCTLSPRSRSQILATCSM